MTLTDPLSFLLLTAILVPFFIGVVLLFGARFRPRQLRLISFIGFGWPLAVGALLFCQFDPSLAGGYNFEMTNAGTPSTITFIDCFITYPKNSTDAAVRLSGIYYEKWYVPVLIGAGYTVQKPR